MNEIAIHFEISILWLIDFGNHFVSVLENIVQIDPCTAFHEKYTLKQYSSSWSMITMP